MSQNWSLEQQKLVVWATKPISMISFLASVTIIYRISKDSARRRLVYHRLVFAMMISSCIMNVFLFVGSLAIPADNGFYLSYGSTASCTTQGLLLTYSTLSIFMYYSMLALFSFVAIRYGFNEIKLRQFEPFFHLFGVLVPAVVALIGGLEGNYRPAGAWCFLGREFRKCDVKTCKLTLAVFLIYIFLFVFTNVMICAVYISANRKKKQCMSLQGKRRFVENTKLKWTAIIRRQAFLYLVALYFGLGFSLFTRFIEWKVGSMPFTAHNLLRHFTTCGQGLFISIVYEATRSKRCQKSNDGKRGDGKQCDETTLVRDIRRNSMNSQENFANESQLLTESLKLNSFSIFDGTVDPSSPWAEHIMSDSEDD